MSEAAKGVWAMVVACVIWGASALYYKLLADVPPLEVLSHRTLWSALFFGAVLAVQGRVGMIAQTLRGRNLWIIGFAALMISLNWFLFIFSVQAGHTVEASMGYYIFPLVAVALGVVVLGERLSVAKWGAVALAAAAVLVLALGLGVTPWIALALGGSFGSYGLVKKQLDIGPLVSVTCEVVLLAPLALLFLAAAHGGQLEGGAREVAWFGRSLGTSALLAFSGLLTGVPLILFSYASRRVRLSTLGLVQYLNPTGQFLCATLVFHEAFTLWHGIAFGLIWVGLAIYSAESLRQEKAARSLAVRASTSEMVTK